MLLALEHEHGRRRNVAMQGAVAAVARPADDHVERPACDIVTEKRVVVADLEGGEIVWDGDLAPAMLRGVEGTLIHLFVLRFVGRISRDVIPVAHLRLYIDVVSVHGLDDPRIPSAG